LLILGDAAALDKSVLGGTILAGDYCFSRSADMAVKTNSSHVVALFAAALKSVSEGNLRHLFDDEDEIDAEEADALTAEQAFDENAVLYHTAIAAATALTHAPEKVTNTLFRLTSRLATAQQGRDAKAAYIELHAMTDSLPLSQRIRWVHFLAWLFASEGDGDARVIL